MTNVKQFNEKTNGLIYIQNNERKANIAYTRFINDFRGHCQCS